jgi:hypothetical protein
MTISTEITAVESTFSKYLALFKAHERLVLFLAMIAFGSFLTVKAYDYLLKHDQTQANVAHDQAVIAANKVSTDVAANQILLAQLAQLQNSYNGLSVQVAASMQQRATQSNNQKHTDDTAAPAELASRIQAVLGVGQIKISAPLGDGLVFDLAAAHATADRLEDLIQAQGDVKDLKGQVTSCNQLVGTQTTTIASLNTTIADGKVALTTEQKSHADDVKTLKLEKKKSWLNGFKWGVITGVVGSLFVHKP